MADRPPGTTALALLGLLALRSWTGYELAKQMGRSLNHVWPHAESGIYREVHRLVESGLASATEEQTGRRPRTRYAITADGRRALADWLAKPQSAGFLESEGLVRVLFADSGTKDDLLGTISAMRGDADGLREQMLTLLREYLVGNGPFPQRSHVNILFARFLIDFAEMVDAWADWAAGVIEPWDEAGHRPPDDPTMELFRKTVAERSR